MQLILMSIKELGAPLGAHWIDLYLNGDNNIL